MAAPSLKKIAYHTLQQGKTLAGLAHKELSTKLMEVFAPEAAPENFPINQDLIKEGFFKNIRNTNYLGEILIYLSFVILSMSFIPLVILTIFFFIVFLPRMIKKDKSLSKYDSFEEYKKKSGLILPKLKA